MHSMIVSSIPGCLSEAKGVRERARAKEGAG
jgi:hypothetical protein